jgi:FkbM family methyltransferase
MLQQLKRIVPLRAKHWIKELALPSVGIPWNRYGLPCHLIEHLPKTGELTLIDVGASNGEFAATLNKYIPLKKALFVEPQPQRIHELKQTFRGDEFHFACAAATDRSESRKMEVLNWDYSSSILPVKRDVPGVNEVIDLGVREIIDCRSATLDELCYETGWEGDVDLLKIDVQGAEHLVLQGAAKTLKRTKVIWIEVSFKPLYEGSSTIETIIRLCDQSGFALTHIDEGFRGSSGELLQGDGLFTRRQA